MNNNDYIYDSLSIVEINKLEQKLRIETKK